ncbi:hypothetical protein C7S15_5685 [Burkholderia cepacia]|nr:hypothetical protein [Burkholderia cepacia]
MAGGDRAPRNGNSRLLRRSLPALRPLGAVVGVAKPASGARAVLRGASASDRRHASG